MAAFLKHIGRAAPRWGILLCALLFGAALMGTAVRSYRDAVGAERVMARGHGEALVHRLRRELIARGVAREDLAQTLAAYDELGLRYIALIGRRGIEAEAGTARGRDETDRAGDLAWIDGRYRLRLPSGRRFRLPERPEKGGEQPEIPERPGAREPLGRLPGPGGWLNRGPPPGGRLLGRRELPDLVIEFEAVGASDLRHRAVVGLGVSSGATLLLTLAAVILWRLSLRAQRMEGQLVRQRHLATLGEMSAVLAHEIRNPLASLKGHAQLLAEEVPEGRPRARVGRVVDEATRLERLTSDLLAFARSGAIQRAPVAPAAVLDAAVEAVGRQRVLVDAAGAPAAFSLDAARMQQVITNLLENALDASPDGVEVAVRTRAAGREAGLEVTVRDRGPGVPPADRERIFEAFHTSKTKGTGLGLAVARRIVELHGGRLTVEDAPGGGALFRAIVPASAPAPQTPAQGGRDVPT